jgi:hypothetical protein
MAQIEYARYFDMKDLSLKTIQTWLGLLICILFLAIALAWILPTEADIESYANESVEAFTLPAVPELHNETSVETDYRPFEGRAGLFKAETPLTTTPRSDKTVENILSQLQLQMIMSQHGKPVAYIILKKKDLRVCSVGDSIEDMVQVTHIDVEEQTIEVLVGGQKETLRL